MNPIIYCFCTKDKDNILSNENQQNIILNSANCTEEEKQILLNRNFLFDDTQDNISSLNKYFGMLTGLYWIWKNSKEKYVGICTYRIYWNGEIDLKDDDLIIPKKVDVNTAILNPYKDQYNILDHYIHCHGDLMLKLLYGALKTSNTRISCEMIDDLLNQNYIHPFNMFITNKETFDKICEILFEVIFLMYYNYIDFFPILEKQTNQIRFLDFLAERLLHTIFVNSKTLLGDINIVEMETKYFPHDYKMMTGAT